MKSKLVLELEKIIIKSGIDHISFADVVADSDEVQAIAQDIGNWLLANYAIKEK